MKQDEVSLPPEVMTSVFLVKTVHHYRCHNSTSILTSLSMNPTEFKYNSIDLGYSVRVNTDSWYWCHWNRRYCNDKMQNLKLNHLELRSLQNFPKPISRVTVMVMAKLTVVLSGNIIDLVTKTLLFVVYKKIVLLKDFLKIRLSKFILFAFSSTDECFFSNLLLMVV